MVTLEEFFKLIENFRAALPTSSKVDARWWDEETGELKPLKCPNGIWLNKSLSEIRQDRGKWRSLPKRKTLLDSLRQVR